MTDFVVVLGLGDLGDIVSVAVSAFAERRGLTVGTDDYPVVADAVLGALDQMYERAEFARSVARDLNELETQPEIHFEPEEGFPGLFTQE